MSDLPTKQQCLEIGTQCLCFNLKKASRRVTGIYDEHFSALGIRATQFALLVALRLFGPCSLNQLATLLVIDRTTLGRNLKLLQADGLAEEQRGKDKRIRLWQLTEQGQETLREAIPRWQAAQQQMLDTLEQQTVLGLNQQLKNLVEAL